jgi:sec-independent protein translocase protein TatB
VIFGLTVEKLLVIGLIAAMILGPERLPKYAAMLGEFVKRARGYVDGAKDRLREEVGDDVDWRSLDPRQYDPRRIVRQALLDDSPVPIQQPSPARHESHTPSSDQQEDTVHENAEPHEMALGGGLGQPDRS